MLGIGGQEGAEETLSSAHPFRVMLLIAIKQTDSAASRKSILFGFKKVI